MTQPAIIGIDVGKNWFHLVGVDAAGAAVFRKKMNRLQIAQFAATAPRCVVATESCLGSQYWGRVFTEAAMTFGFCLGSCRRHRVRSREVVETGAGAPQVIRGQLVNPGASRRGADHIR